MIGGSDEANGRRARGKSTLMSYVAASSLLTIVLLVGQQQQHQQQGQHIFVSAASNTGSADRQHSVPARLHNALAANHAFDNTDVQQHQQHHRQLRGDESDRIDGMLAGEDRELLGAVMDDIFLKPRGGGGSKKSKSSSSGSKTTKKKKKYRRRRKKSSSESASGGDKKKKRRRHKKSSSSDTKSKSKTKSDDDLVKLSINKSYSDYDESKSTTKKKSADTKSSNKKSISKTDVHPSERLCNTSKERQCRDDCFKDNKCKRGHVLSPCHKKCRYKCCDPDSAYEEAKDKTGTNAGDLCQTSEEKMCRIKCFEKKSCGDGDNDEDEDCRKDCRLDCCSGDGSKKSKDTKKKSDSDSDSGSDDRHSKKDSGKDAEDDDGDDDGDKKDKSESYRPLKWSGIPSKCEEDVEKFNSCYENQYEKGKECYGYNAARELDDIFEAVSKSDRLDYTCGDWYDFICPIRADTSCCRNRIRGIGRCLGRELFDVGGSSCDDTCQGYGNEEVIGNELDPVEFSTLIGLLTDYDLDGILSGDDPITVLAPTNEAFEEFIASLPDEGDLSLESLADSGLLEEVLKYHVLVGDFSYDELQDGGRFETMQGERVKTASTDEDDDYDDLYALTVDGERFVGRYDRACRVDGGKGDFDKDENVDLATCQETCAKDEDCVGYEYNSDKDACEYHKESGLPYLGEKEGAFDKDDEDGLECFWKISSGNGGGLILNDDAMVIRNMKDIEGSNGFVHAIDKVLLPPSVANAGKNLMQIASIDGDFSTAADILAQLELEEFFQGRGPFTLFLPTNQAFEDLLDALPEDGPYSFDGLFDSGALLDIVKYHAIQGAQVLSSDIFNGDRYRSIQGERMQVTITGDSDVLINGAATVILPDIIGENGVIHGIDQVLIPPTITDATIGDGDDYNPLDWANADVPSNCRGLVEDFNNCYDNNAGVGGVCYNFDAARALDDLRDISNRADRNYRRCEDWLGLVCDARDDADGCCSSKIREIGNCLGDDVWGHNEDDCDFECGVDDGTNPDGTDPDGTDPDGTDPDGTDPDSESYNPLSTDDAPRACRSEVNAFNSCYKRRSDFFSCKDFDAEREMRDLFEITGDGPDFIFYDDCQDYFKLACSFRKGVDCCVDEISDIETCLGEVAYGFRETRQFRDGECDITCNSDGTIETDDGSSSSQELFTGRLTVPFRFNINTAPRIVGSDIMRGRGNTIREDIEGGLALLVPDIVDETFDTFDDDRQVGFTGRDDPEITDVINIDCPIGAPSGVGCRKVTAEVILQVVDESETQVRREFSRAMADAITDGRLESKIKQFNPDYNKEPEKTEPDGSGTRNVDDGLTNAQIAGIAVGSLAGVLLLGVLAASLAKQSKSSRETNYDPSESQYASQGYADNRYGGDEGYEVESTVESQNRYAETQALTNIDEGEYEDEYHEKDGGEQIQYDGGGYEDGEAEYHDGHDGEAADDYAQEGDFQDEKYQDGASQEETYQEGDYR